MSTQRYTRRRFLKVCGHRSGDAADAGGGNRQNQNNAAKEKISQSTNHSHRPVKLLAP